MCTSPFADVAAEPSRSNMALPFNAGGLLLTRGALAGTLDRRFASSDGLDAIEGRWRGRIGSSCRERLGGAGVQSAPDS
jgi:hypothetical protein